MWLYTTIGFFSVINVGSDRMMVRSRHRADLERLKLIDVDGWDATATEIIVSPDRDYRYRIVVSSSTFEALVVKLVRDITYHNFKAAAGILGPKRAQTLHKIWAVTLNGAADEKG